MISVTSDNNMFYEDYNPRCKFVHGTLMYAPMAGQDVAYIQCIDLNTDEEKRYWGVFDFNDIEGSVKNIMKYGDRWPKLPSIE